METRPLINTKQEAHQWLRDNGHITYSYDIAEEATEDFGDIFAVYILNKKYLESGDVNDMEVGSGPTLVEKATGKVHHTGSAYDTDYYVEALRATGNTESFLTSVVKITFVPENADLRTLEQLIALSTEHRDLLQARQRAQAILAGEVKSIDCLSYKEMSVYQTLKDLGYGAELIWETYEKPVIGVADLLEESGLPKANGDIDDLVDIDWDSLEE